MYLQCSPFYHSVNGVVVTWNPSKVQLGVRFPLNARFFSAPVEHLILRCDSCTEMLLHYINYLQIKMLLLIIFCIHIWFIITHLCCITFFQIKWYLSAEFKTLRYHNQMCKLIFYTFPSSPQVGICQSSGHGQRMTSKFIFLSSGWHEDQTAREMILLTLTSHFLCLKILKTSLVV